jgi:carbamoyl-phosphate synthase large subunit
MLNQKRVFVSGGAGVIGRVLVRKLYQMGAVIFVGDLKPKPKKWPGDILYWQGDLNYISDAELESFSPEYFFHLAATFERSTETYDFWNENYHHNVNLSHYLMNILKNHKALKKVIFASSYLIYKPDLYNFCEPQQKAIRLKEGDAIYPRNLCGAAKLYHEAELEFLNKFDETSFDTVCARIFRVYGKDSRDIISRWVRLVLRGETITVYRPEGRFDYIYADDVAEGLIRLALCPARGIVNLGNDNARSIQEVLDILKGHFPDMKISSANIDIPYEASQANMDYFESLTGYKPKTQLDEGITEIIKYEKERLKISGETEVGSLKNILVTSISKKVPMLKAIRSAYLKAGGQDKLIGGDVDEYCIGRYFVDLFWKMPRLEELNVDDLIRYCKEQSIFAIIPSRDGELIYFAENKEKLEENGIKVMISSYDAITICLDKLTFYEKLSTMGFPVIQTTEDVHLLQSNAIVVKERFGAGSENIALNITVEQAIRHASKLKNPVFQPYIPGEEISVDIYIDLHGKTKGVVLRRRELIVKGESQVTTTFTNPGIEKIFSDLAERLGLYGHIVMQAIVDSSGKIQIMECNSRFGGASTLSIAVGLDSFFWFLLESSGTDISEYPYLRTGDQKRLVRHPEDIIININ